MNSRLLRHTDRRFNWAILRMLALLLLSAELLAAQATISAGPLLLHQVRTIYVAAPSDELAVLLKARLEKWDAVEVTSKPKEADAILTYQCQSTVVPAKVVIRRTTAEVSLVDRRFQKLIWKTIKSTSFDGNTLADDIVEQLKKDWKKSANEY